MTALWIYVTVDELIFFYDMALQQWNHVDLCPFCTVKISLLYQTKGTEDYYTTEVCKISSLSSLWLRILVDNTVCRGLQLMPFPTLMTFI
jgi:hypothetical protein